MCTISRTVSHFLFNQPILRLTRFNYSHNHPKAPIAYKTGVSRIQLRSYFTWKQVKMRFRGRKLLFVCRLLSESLDAGHIPILIMPLANSVKFDDSLRLLHHPIQRVYPFLDTCLWPVSTLGPRKALLSNFRKGTWLFGNLLFRYASITPFSYSRIPPR